MRSALLSLATLALLALSTAAAPAATLTTPLNPSDKNALLNDAKTTTTAAKAALSVESVCLHARTAKLRGRCVQASFGPAEAELQMLTDLIGADYQVAMFLMQQQVTSCSQALLDAKTASGDALISISARGNHIAEHYVNHADLHGYYAAAASLSKALAQISASC